MDNQPPIFLSDGDAFDTWMALNEERKNLALVEKDGEVIGTVGSEDFGSIIQLRKNIKVAQ